MRTVRNTAIARTGDSPPPLHLDREYLGKLYGTAYGHLGARLVPLESRVVGIRSSEEVYHVRYARLGPNLD
ncbi:hypothetical protein RSAG8_05714, partial [Rhizoctonia solani AG-8 WAC10335]